MPTIDEAVEAAENLLSGDQSKEAYKSLTAVLNSLNKDSAARRDFPRDTLVRLVVVLKGLGDELDDGSEQYDQAQQVLDKALKWYPNDELLTNSQGWLYYDRCQYDKALEEFGKVMKPEFSANRNSKIIASRGKVASCRELRLFDDAEEVCNAFAENGQTLPIGILIERGWLRLYQKRYEDAFRDFKKASESDRISGAAREEARAGQIAARQAEDRQTLKSDKDRGKDLLAEWSKAPTNLSKEDAVRILIICGQTHDMLNHYRASLLAYDLALTSGSSNQSQIRKAWRAKIDALQWLRRYEDAEREYLLAQEKFPDSIELWKEIAYAYYWQKRFPESYSYFSGAALTEVEFTEPQARENLDQALKEDLEAAEWTVVLLRKLRRLPEAEIAVNNALAKFGNRAGLLAEKGVIHFSRQEYEKAIATFDRALKIDDYNSFAIQWRAASFRKLGKFPEAKKAITQALKKLPAEAGLWEELAWISFDQNDLKKADELFAKSIELDPYSFQRQCSRAEVLVRRNLNDEALRIFKELKEQYPNDPEVAEQLGWFYLRRGELKLAEDEFCMIQKTDPTNALGINGLGGCYLEERNYQGAEEAFRWAIETVGYEPQYHLNLAWSLVRQVKEPGEIPESECSIREELLDEASMSCRQALELDPQSAKAYICLGVIAFKRGALLDAEAYFRRSLELEPRVGSGVELGALYVQMGRYEDAKNELREAIKLNSNDARAHLELGNLLLLTESNKEAIRECRQAVSVEPNNYELHRALAIALMRSGQYDEAEKALRKAIMRFGPARQGPLRLALSQVLIRLGDENNKNSDLYAEALIHINQAKREGPNADVFFHSGIVRYKLEEYGLARKDFSECLKANRDRFEAERFGKLAQSMVKEARKISRITTWAGGGIAILCGMMLITLWGFYLKGWKREALPSDATAVNSSTTQTEKADAAKTVGAALPEAAPSTAAAKQVEPKSTSTSTAKEELVVDKSMLTVMTPLLLGLVVVGLVLPNLTKLKLFGGFEAEISEVKTRDISSGPKGDIGFGSSIPTISPGPR